MEDDILRRLERLEDKADKLPPAPDTLPEGWKRLLTSLVWGRTLAALSGVTLLLALGVFGWVDRVARGVTEEKITEFKSDASELVFEELRQDSQFQSSIAELAKASFGGFVLAYVSEEEGGAPCPNGWVQMEKAAGRFLLGAGARPDDKDIKGNPLLSVSYPDVGGVLSYQLEADQLPAHNHPMGIEIAKQAGRQFGLQGGGNFVDASIIRDRTDSISDPMRSRNNDTGNRSVDNMPPYLAVEFCILKPKGDR